MRNKRLTDMDIRNPSLESIDTSEDWVSLPENDAAEEILEVERTHTALTELADRVDTVRDQGSLEAYQWAFKALAGMTPVTERKNISLEGFSGTITKKSALSQAIRNEAAKLKTKLNVALESYAKDVREDHADSLHTYEQALRKLKATDTGIDKVPKGNVEVNHTRVFEMFMVKDQFRGKEPLAAIKDETSRLERLVSTVGRAVQRLSSDVGKLGEDDKLERTSRDLPDTNAAIYLMFNRKVTIKEGQFDNETKKSRGPRKSYSWGQLGWIFLGGMIFQQAGSTLAKAFIGEKKDTEAKVSNSLTEIHKYIRAVEALDELIEDLTGHVEELVKLFDQVSEEQESALNRRIVPIMELVGFIMKQAVDITKGTDSLFTKLVRKHS